MIEDKFLGPIYIDYNQKSYRCFYRTVKSRYASLKCFYGSLVIFLPIYTSRFRFHTNNVESLTLNDDLVDKLYGFTIDLIEKTDAIHKLERKGIYLYGQSYLSSSKVYMLGKEYEVTSDIAKKNENTFFASSFDSLQKLYSELAYNSLKKRLDYLGKLMGLNYECTLSLSRAVNYLGMNSIKKHHIKLNEALYSFNKEVGDSVIIHELAHCFHPDHSKEFYNLVLKYCPNYYKYEKLIMAGRFLEQ